MRKLIMRILVVVAMSAAILMLGRDGIAWATAQTTIIGNVPQAPAGAPASAPRGGNPGTVQPPPSKDTIAQSGTYSVGGFCSLAVTFTASGNSVTAGLVNGVPNGVPPHAVRLGCSVTFYSGTTFLAQLSPNGTMQICFAAIPNHTMTIAFYNSYSSTPTWTTLTTTVTNGIACANGSASGIYTATVQ